MDDENTMTRTSRALLSAKVGLIGLAAAATIGAVLLAAGAWASPSGTRAADGGTATSPAVGLSNGYGVGPDGDGPGPMDDGRMGGGRGFGGGITVTAISGSSVSLKTEDGWTRTITIASDTVLQKAGATIKVSDLKVGDEVRFRQTRQSDGSYKIDQLVVVLPHVGGTVTAVSGSTITVKQRDGSTATIKVESATTYRVNGATGSLSGIKVGMLVMAEGTKASDGSLTAAAVQAFDPSTFQGPGRHHGMGPGWGPGAGNGTNPGSSAAPGASGATTNL